MISKLDRKLLASMVRVCYQLAWISEVYILNLEFLVWLRDMVKQISSLYVGLVFLTLLTYETTSKRLLITQMYVKDSKIFVATQVWQGRPLQPYSSYLLHLALGLSRTVGDTLYTVNCSMQENSGNMFIYSTLDCSTSKII